jgi:hypothetical protein
VTADGQVVTASETQNADLFGGSAVVAATSASWSTSNSDSTGRTNGPGGADPVVRG